jgi:hypothetical protein
MNHDATAPLAVDEQHTTPSLPSLDPGVYFVDVDACAVGTIQSLVIDHVLTGAGSTTCWVNCDRPSPVRTDLGSRG